MDKDFSLNTYLLSKLLPLIFSPLGIILILLLTFIFRKKAYFIYSALFFLFFFSNGIISDILLRFLEYPLERLDYAKVTSADGIVVLSGGRNLPPGDTKIIEWNDPDRFISGINLYKANKANKLFFTGGINPLNSKLPPEGDIYMREAISMGIPSKALYTTYPVLNTLQEAKAIKELLNNEIASKHKKIILVTSAFHMKRAKRVFEREGISIVPYPVDFRSNKSLTSTLYNPVNWFPSAFHLNESSLAIREIIGRVIYRTLR